MLEKRANTLHNIQTLLARVEDAQSDSEILDSYKTALARLRAMFNETGLTEESVSETMLELEEVSIEPIFFLFLKSIWCC